VFGESAGAASVGTLLGTPGARGLFRGAIPQSGAASWVATREQATKVAQLVVDKLAVQAGDVDALLAKSTDEILAAMPEFREDGVASLPFQPVVDDVVLHEPPLAAIAAGNAAGVHVLTGTNLTEMTLFTLGDPAMGTLDDEAIRRRLVSAFGPTGASLLGDYRLRRPDATPQELWLALSTDGVFRIPAIRLLEAQAAHAPVWSYLFTFESPVFGGILRSTHALEIPFVFDTLDASGADMLTGTGPERQGIADAMHGAWIAFAQHGDPGHAGLPQWPSYDLDRRATMRFDAECEVLDDPEPGDRLAFVAVA
jgi:para-nitrobenzyl esterase